MRPRSTITAVALGLVFCLAGPSSAAPPEKAPKNPVPAQTAPTPVPAEKVKAITAEIPDPIADPELRALVDGVKTYYEKVDHLRADFKQVVKQRTMSRTRKASGTIAFHKPGKMRWVYERPDEVLYVSDGETLWIYQVEDALVYQTRIKGSRLYNALRFLFGMGDLERVFSIAMGPAHSPETAYLVLTPRDGGQDYKDISLVVDRKTFEIRESFLTDPLGNITHYIFDNLDYETPVPESDFKFVPPPGVTIQKL